MIGRRRAGLVVGAALGLGALAPAAAPAATLVGGRAQARIRHAFNAQPAHRGQTIVSIRASTVAPAWAVVRSVIPQRAVASGTRTAAPGLRSTFYRRAGDRETEGAPPRAARRDLEQPFEVAVVYSGSGSESIAYDQLYGSACAGQGGLAIQQTDDVTPMSWSVRYLVELDHLMAAVRGAGGTVLVPQVSFDATGSHVDATERVSQTIGDSGCGGTPTTISCATRFRAGGSNPGALLSFDAGGGLEVGVPTAARTAGACDPDDYTLGASLWDAGAASARADRLGLLGGSLPSDPYAPVRVSWPVSAAPTLAASPCQGDGVACSDRFQWTGTVRLQPVGGG